MKRNQMEWNGMNESMNQGVSKPMFEAMNE
jgi:hypothetical protein